MQPRSFSDCNAPRRDRVNWSRRSISTPRPVGSGPESVANSLGMQLVKTADRLFFAVFGSMKPFHTFQRMLSSQTTREDLSIVLAIVGIIIIQTINSAHYTRISAALSVLRDYPISIQHPASPA